MAPRLPPAALQPGLRLLRRLVFNADIPIPVQRTRMNAALRATVFAPPRTTIRDVTVGRVPGLRIESGAVDQRRLIVHLHGGAYCIGSPLMAKAFAARLSRRTRAAVLVPDFRLALEHPFPAALDDVTALLVGLLDESNPPAAGRAAAAPLEIALTGDSAGAALAVAACPGCGTSCGPHR